MFIAGVGQFVSEDEQGIIEEIIYDVDGHQLAEIKVMLETTQIARCWQEKRKGKVVGTHYTLPTWYVRYKKLDEIL
jgi:hypothetical protein